MKEQRERRLRGASALVGSREKAKQTLGWRLQYSNLENIIAHA